MKKISSLLLIVFGFITLSGMAVFAADQKPAASAVAPAADKVSQDAMMEKMKQMMSPSAAHKILEPLAGKWTYTSKFWSSKDGKAEETAGTSDQAIVFGGRFLKIDVKGTWMGQPFEGIGYTGYDNIKQEYVSTWLDSMATGIMTDSGQYDEATKTLRTSGTCSCPLTGEKARPHRAEWTITDNDHNTYATYLKNSDGTEFKAMEINYERVKA